MNSTKLHSLAGCGEKNNSRRLWFATLESKEMNKRKGEPGGDSPRQALQTERATWNTCRLRRIPTGGKTGEAPGAWQQREKERRRKRKRQLGRRIELGSAELNAQIGRF